MAAGGCLIGAGNVIAAVGDSCRLDRIRSGGRLPCCRGDRGGTHRRRNRTRSGRRSSGRLETGVRGSAGCRCYRDIANTNGDDASGCGGASLTRQHVARQSSVTVQPRGRVSARSRHQEDSLESLGAADVVIGVGQGVVPEELHALDELRDVLGAQIGCTRKVTDSGWMPHARQIGVTGRAISPRLYVAVGTSGKFNHMIGVRAAGTVLAINPDPDALVWRYADVGVVARFQECVPLLVKNGRSCGRQGAGHIGRAAAARVPNRSGALPHTTAHTPPVWRGQSRSWPGDVISSRQPMAMRRYSTRHASTCAPTSPRPASSRSSPIHASPALVGDRQERTPITDFAAR